MIRIAVMLLHRVRTTGCRDPLAVHLRIVGAAFTRVVGLMHVRMTFNLHPPELLHEHLLRWPRQGPCSWVMANAGNVTALASGYTFIGA